MIFSPNYAVSITKDKKQPNNQIPKYRKIWRTNFCVLPFTRRVADTVVYPEKHGSSNK